MPSFNARRIYKTFLGGMVCIELNVRSPTIDVNNSVCNTVPCIPGTGTEAAKRLALRQQAVRLLDA